MTLNQLCLRHPPTYFSGIIILTYTIGVQCSSSLKFYPESSFQMRKRNYEREAVEIIKLKSYKWKLCFVHFPSILFASGSITIHFTYTETKSHPNLSQLTEINTGFTGLASNFTVKIWLRWSQGCPKRNSLGALPFHKSVLPLKGLNYHETQSLVQIVFLEPYFWWLVVR